MISGCSSHYSWFEIFLSKKCMHVKKQFSQKNLVKSIWPKTKTVHGCGTISQMGIGYQNLPACCVTSIKRWGEQFWVSDFLSAFFQNSMYLDFFSRIQYVVVLCTSNHEVQWYFCWNFCHQNVHSTFVTKNSLCIFYQNIILDNNELLLEQ